MSKINILPEKVYNRIAAGEVIDKPYSIIKELVENSIDAGATEIEIYVEKAGRQLVRVIDNGCGIEREDLHAAFLPHATSKLSKAEDLEGILTLGFRGEAVASIASVSVMTIKSKTQDGKCYSLTSRGGDLGEIVETTGQNGTEVTVEDLFYNTPVRYEFVGGDRAEEANITTFVSRFILNRSDIAFTYYLNGKKVLQSFGGGMEEAIVGIYGASILSNCYKINAEKHGIKIRGYIGNQNFFKANKSYQSVFLNGRYIQNATISAALSNAYSGYAMKRQYPFYVLHITIPPEVVDVNVHPHKSDVRFRDNNLIYGCIYSVITSVLDGNSKALEYVEEEKVEQQLIPQTPLEEDTESKKSLSQRILDKVDAEQSSGVINLDIFKNDVFTYEQAKEELKANAPIIPSKEEFLSAQNEEKDIEDELSFKRGFIPIDAIGEFDPASAIKPTLAMAPYRKKDKKDAEKLSEKYPDLFFQTSYLEVDDSGAQKQKNVDEGKDYFEENKKYLNELENKSKQNVISVVGCRYAGKLFNTYILYERGDEVYIIDQHAAHERLIYNRLKEKMQDRKVARQPMLVPYTVRVNAFEATFLNERLDDIREMGFDILQGEDNVFYVSSIPVDLQTINLDVFFNGILSEINGYRAIKLENLLKDKLASAACKAAVKGGMDLTQQEVETLFEMMNGDMGLKCPHGRPVVVKMDKKQLEKMFKRIV